MKTKTSQLFIVLVVLVLASLACQTVLGGKSEDQALENAPALEQAEPSGPEPASQDSPDENLPTEPEIQLGDEYRSEEGGYAFRTVPGFVTEEFIGFASLVAPDSEDVNIILVGGANQDGVDLDGLYQEAVEGVKDDDIEISDRRSITVDGLQGYVVDIHGFDGEMEMNGRIVVVAVSPNHEFTMVGSAPTARWENELEGYFDAVLGTVQFFEPTEVEFTFEEEQTDDVRQWASGATASSQYNTPGYAAMQATGEPDTLIDYCGTVDTAWASYEGYTVEWIELSYDQAVIPTEINIIQTSAPNQVVQVDVIGVDGNYETVYTGEPEKIIEGCPFVLTVNPIVDYEINGVKVTIDQTVLEYPWNEIDAVELVGSPDGEGALTPPSATGNIEGVLWRAGGESGSDEGQIGGLGGMDIGPDGRIYVADDTFGVRVYNVDEGSLVKLISHDDLWIPMDVQVASDGTIFVADWGANAVFKFSSEGELLSHFGEAGTGPGQFGTFSPDSLALGPDGNVYVLDENTNDAGEDITQIQVFSSDGSYLRKFTIDFEDPSIEEMAFGPDGNLYLVDWFGDVLLQYSAEGNFIGKIGEEALSYASPQDVAIDKSGNFYVAIWSPEGVLKLDSSGAVVGQFGSDVEDGENPWMEGMFYSISGVAVVSDGLRVFASDGSGTYSYITAFEFK